jgi:organic radical activating enzyme
LKQKIIKETEIKVVEIFRTIEGEGRWVGLPIVFIRLEGCNLRCEWCDTKYSYDGITYKTYKISDLLNEIKKHKLKRVCITGGEPFYTKELPLLTEALLERDYKVFIETNGTLWLPEMKNFFNENLYITCSPKPPTYYVHPKLIPFISELKFVIDKYIQIDNIIKPDFIPLIKNDVIVLQPESNRSEMVAKALYFQDQLLEHGVESRIIPQCHKVLGLP